MFERNNTADASESKNVISDDLKSKFKAFCKKQFDFTELSELFPDKTIKSIEINFYRGPKYYPSHGIPPDEEISVVKVEFSDGTSLKTKFTKEVRKNNISSDTQNHTLSY